MMAVDVVEMLDVFPGDALVFTDDRGETFPVFDVSNDNSSFYIQCGWAPLSSISKSTLKEALSVSGIISLLQRRESGEVLCKIQGDNYIIDSIQPFFTLTENKSIWCSIKVIPVD